MPYCCAAHAARGVRRAPARGPVVAPEEIGGVLQVRLPLGPVEGWCVDDALVFLDLCGLREYGATFRRLGVAGTLLAQCARSHAALVELLALAGCDAARGHAEASKMLGALRAHMGRA
jgi:hypothetical protein